MQWAEDFTGTSQKKIHKRLIYTHEKMVNIIRYQGNANFRVSCDTTTYPLK